MNHQTELDGITYSVDFYFNPAERANYDIESPTCGPGCAASVDIWEIRIKPEGLNDWLLTPIEKWDANSPVFQYLESECLDAALVATEN